MIADRKPRLQVEIGIGVEGLLQLAFARWESKGRPGRRTRTDQLAIDPHLCPVVCEELGQAGVDDAIRIGDVQRHAEVDQRAASAGEAVVRRRAHQEIERTAVLDRRITA